MVDRSRSRLTNQVFEKIREDIVCGRLAPDAPLSEADLCLELEVSRTPVREALIKLAEEELVVIYPHFGTFVAPISLEAFKVGQYIREKLECALVEDAIKRMDDDGRERIRANLREQAAAVGNGDTFYQLDNVFHALIAELSGYAGAWNAILRAKTQLDRIRYLTTQDSDRMTLALNEHQMIADAIIAGDADTAVVHMRAHLRTVFGHIDGLGLDAPRPGLPSRKRGGRGKSASSET
ncbi:GntR family transcriptional regulator [Rhizobium wenxiniae]|uniref:GntR family transcriptional regulator n=1 Tax=Rhizobium wenxiniae TaxID=1737357 RepID=UPI001C6E5AFB|nr:GntR family transcriptional regulator [Rhizobium wenxiniae]MBW9090985.1 GntR family transcriptional regulator [Rhizobium wenxiniae]